jgi:Na+/melibiose symporter-like transporter
VLSIVGVTVFVYGVVRGGDTSWGSTEVLAALGAGLGLIGAFLVWERRAPNPILELTLFKRPQFSAAVAVIFLSFLSLMGLVFFLSFYFQSARDFTPLKTGLVLLPLAAGQLLFSSRSAGFVERFGARRVTAVGLLLMTIAFGYYTTAGANSPLWVLELVLFLEGAGIANVMPPSTSAIMASVPREKAGQGSAIGNTMRQLGGALGVAILGSILSSAYRTTITPKLERIPALAHNPGALHDAASSITATLSFAAHAGPAGRALVDPATNAFIDAMHGAALAAVAVGIIGIVISLRWLPGRVAPAADARPANATAPGARDGARDEPAPAMIEV